MTYKYKLPHAPAIKAAPKNYKPKEVNPDVFILALAQHDLETEPGLVIVVDCKPLARVLNGQEALVNKDMAPLCTRVTD